MQASLFSHAHSKIMRADQHINQLETFFGHLSHPDFYEVALDPDPESGGSLVRVTTAEGVTTTLALIIGDAVHNIRASLDYLTSAIARHMNRSTVWVTFPIHEERQSLISSFETNPLPGKRKGSNAFIKEGSPKLTDIIVDQVQPYRGGQFQVWETNALDRIDKHNLLIPAIRFTEIHGFRAVDHHFDNSFEGTLGHAGDGTSFPIAYLQAGNLEIENKGTAAVSVLFGEETPYPSEPVIPTLLRLSQLTKEVIDIFDKNIGLITT